MLLTELNWPPKDIGVPCRSNVEAMRGSWWGCKEKRAKLQQLRRIPWSDRCSEKGTLAVHNLRCVVVSPSLLPVMFVWMTSPLHRLYTSKRMQVNRWKSRLSDWSGRKLPEVCMVFRGCPPILGLSQRWTTVRNEFVANRTCRSSSTPCASSLMVPQTHFRAIQIQFRHISPLKLKF